MLWMLLLLGLMLGSVPRNGETGSVTSEQTTVPYTALVAVDQTAVEIRIDFQGDGTADNAKLVSVYHKAGNGVYCVTKGTATATGAPLEVGMTYNFPLGSGQPVSRLSCVCAAAEVATIHIFAYP
jgi:hypothetical protein